MVSGGYAATDRENHNYRPSRPRFRIIVIESRRRIPENEHEIREIGL